MQGFYEQLSVALSGDQPFTLALISGAKGSSPQRVGAKALFFQDGRIVGTLGGGCLEAEVNARALRALQTGESAAFEMVLDHDFGWDDGLICGGSVTGLILPGTRQAAALWPTLVNVTVPVSWGVKKDFSIAPALNDEAEWLYRETVSPPCPLWIAGSGHVAQAVVPLALELDFAVTVFDDRPELANHRCFPAGTRLQVGPWHELLKEPAPRSPAFGLIVTRGHQHDALVLAEWVRQPFGFLGMIGSRRKARVIREQFVRQNIATSDQMARVACPVGVDIRAQTTREIAVSIMGQYIQKRAELLAPRRG
jgi:xanthine dehydrogenase accessory factor